MKNNFNLSEQLNSIFNNTQVEELKIKLKEISSPVNEFTNIIRKIIMPEITDERLNYLISSNKKWGELGWTTLPFSENLFNKSPDEYENADNIAMSIIEDKDSKLFDLLREHNIDKLDLEETIYCYNQKKYKSCAFVLFSLIENKLITYQSSSIEYKSNLKVGFKATKRLEEKNMYIREDSNILILKLDFENLLSCLKTFFDNTENFSIEPFVINRNLLLHGMYDNQVTKQDCIKLFLALYNLVLLLKIINHENFESNAEA